MQKKEEIIVGLLSAILSVFLSHLFILKFPDYLFEFSGYDLILTGWIKTPYESIMATVRHPLMIVFLIPVSILYNTINSDYVILLFISVIYSLTNIVLYRTIRYNFNTALNHCILLIFLFNSFSYVLSMSFVPESYNISQLLLVWSFYKFTGKKQLSKKNLWLMFMLTAGITVTNGLKIILAWIFRNKAYKTNIKQVIIVSIIFLSIITPVYLISKNIYNLNSFHSDVSSNNITENVKLKSYTQTHENDKATNILIKNNQKTSVPGFMKFIGNEGIPYFKNILENFMGEAVLFHDSKLQQDVSKSRPVIVNYRHIINYVLITILYLLFFYNLYLIKGTDIFMFSILFLGVDILIHLIGMYGFNELYIFSPHWLFLIPIVIAAGFKIQSKIIKIISTVLILLCTCLLSVLNFTNLFSFLISN